jgi:hypothetical protein
MHDNTMGGMKEVKALAMCDEWTWALETCKTLWNLEVK